MTKILIGRGDTDLDYPVCRPSLDLDFTQEELDPRITFTRGSIGTRVNRNRVIETVAANTPRFDYDPVTGECKGLLIEESRSNNLLQSSRLDTSWLITVSGGSGTFIDGEKVTSSILSVDAIYDASLSTSSTFILRNSLSGQPYGTLTGLSSGATRTINSQTNIGVQNNISAFLTTETTAPDGTNNAVLVTPTTAGSQIRTIVKRFTTSTAGTYTFSVFFKNKNITNNNVAIYIGNQTSASNVVANFTLSTKTFSVVSQNGGWTGSVGYQDYANGWGRIWVTATTTAGSHTFLDCGFWIGGFQGTYTSVGSLYAWGMQLETGAFPTSYIPTSASTVTRSADLASMTGTNFSSWYNQNEGTLYASAAPSTNAAYTGWIYLLGIDFNNGISFYRQLDYQAVIRIRSSVRDEYNKVFGAVGFGQIWRNAVSLKSAFAFKTNDFNSSISGIFQNISRATSGTLPSFTGPLWLGGEKDGNNKLNGTISRLIYYPRALKPNQLQYLTQ
jgi:hypothetical protein